MAPLHSAVSGAAPAALVRTYAAGAAKNGTFDFISVDARKASEQDCHEK
jgi:hypothetical protein